MQSAVGENLVKNISFNKYVMRPIVRKGCRFSKIRVQATKTCHFTQGRQSQFFTICCQFWFGINQYDVCLNCG